jgi:hypothetical protein
MIGRMVNELTLLELLDICWLRVAELALAMRPDRTLDLDLRIILRTSQR